MLAFGLKRRYIRRRCIAEDHGLRRAWGVKKFHFRPGQVICGYVCTGWIGVNVDAVPRLPVGRADSQMEEFAKMTKVFGLVLKVPTTIYGRIFELRLQSS